MSRDNKGQVGKTGDNRDTMRDNRDMTRDNRDIMRDDRDATK